MLEAFEKHLKHRKNIIDLEKIETHEDLLKFCKTVLEKDGYVVRKNKEILYARDEILSQELYNIDLEILTRISKEKIKKQLFELFIKKYPIQYITENVPYRMCTIITGKMEI